MLTNHLWTGLYLGLCLSVVSWMVGIIGHALLQRTALYGRLSRLNFVRSRAANAWLGLAPFKRIIKNSVLRFLNQSLKVEGPHTDLVLLRDRMTGAEIGHLVGFVFVSAFAVAQSVAISPVFGLAMMIPNALLNGYPTLLQQENKRRIDRVLQRQSSRGVVSR
ncbi:MAG: hypothetical protein SFW08_02345 [Gemmatimonadaceae bacterium]|nr:hypothetical protein [Gemmatimonadaceae bacterium]